MQSVTSFHVRREKYGMDFQPLICFIQSYKNIYQTPMKLFIKDFNCGFSVNHMASSNLCSDSVLPGRILLIPDLKQKHAIYA